MNMEHSAKLERETEKISLRRSRSPDNAKFGHFTLLFCKGRKAIVLLIRPFFCDVAVAVAVVVFLNSLLFHIATQHNME